MFNNFCQKIVLFMRLCGKIWQSRTGRRRQTSTAHALCMPDKATNTHSEYVIHIAFPPQ
jgi:hypothetical protein